jgi:hypothetical protein
VVNFEGAGLRPLNDFFFFRFFGFELKSCPCAGTTSSPINAEEKEEVHLASQAKVAALPILCSCNLGMLNNSGPNFNFLSAALWCT